MATWFLYLLLAGVGAGFDFLLFLGLSSQLPIQLASSFSTAAASVLSFLLNSRFTFRTRISVRSTSKFFAVVAAASYVGGVLTWALSEQSISDEWSKLISMGVISLLQLAIHTRWTFRN